MTLSDHFLIDRAGDVLEELSCLCHVQARLGSDKELMERIEKKATDLLDDIAELRKLLKRRFEGKARKETKE